MIGIDKVKVHLMMRETSICSFDLSLSDQLLTISNTTFNDTSHFEKLCNECNLYDFIMSRMMPSNNRNYINIIAFTFQDKSRRYPYGQFALSLATNCVSLSDHFWLNPEQDIIFDYLGKTINFKQQTWQQICAQQNSVWSDDLNQFLFHDMLLVNCFEQPINTNNPIFTTNGNKEKLWFYDEDSWWLEKRMESNQLNAEVECLSFFKSRGVLTPDLKMSKYDVSNKYLFLPGTIRNGISAIQKRRITSRETQLIPINRFIKDDCQDDIRIVLKYARERVCIDKKELYKFEDTIIEYLSNYHYGKIASSNFGFFVDSNDNAVPAVWSNVGYMDKNPF